MELLFIQQHMSLIVILAVSLGMNALLFTKLKNMMQKLNREKRQANFYRSEYSALQKAFYKQEAA